MPTRFLFLCLLLLTLSLLPARSTVAQELPAGGFVVAEGDRLTRLGREVRIKGANYYPQGLPWAEMWSDWDGPQVARELALAQQELGLNTIRVLVPYEITMRSGDNSVTGEAVHRLRQLAQIAGELDMRLIVTLFDFEEDFPPAGSAEEARHLHYLRTMIGNFAGDDRILAWDLHNEPDHYKLWRNGGAPEVLDWLGRMADAAHQAAPHHLITVGMGQYDNLWQPGPDGRRVIDYSDLISVHIYNAADAARQLDELRSYTNKPILVQEFGWPTGPHCAVQAYSEATQEWMYRTVIEAAAPRTVGVVAWTLRDYDPGPSGRWDTREEHYGLFRPDDSLKPAALILRDYPAEPLPSLTQVPVELTATPDNPANSVSGPLLIPESGRYVKRDFRRAWELFGGRASFGLPLTEAFVRPADGRVVQYFEGALLEYHPQAAQDPFFHLYSEREQVSRLIRPVNLGETFTEGREFAPPRPGQHEEIFSETGYALAGMFREFYHSIGGEWRMGAPISNLRNEEVAGRQLQLQYFENGRLQWDAATETMSVSQFGRQALDIQCRYGE